MMSKQALATIIMVAVSMAVCNAKVVDIMSKAQFVRELDGAGERLVLLIFEARWNPKSISTFSLIKNIESKHTDSMLVLRVNAEHFKAIAEAYEVKSLPTVVTIRNNSKVKLVGAELAYYDLKNQIEKEIKKMGV